MPPTSATDEGGAAVDAPAVLALEISGLRAGYGRDVLFGVDMRVAPGEIVAVLGHNGAGKSTLLKAALGLVTPTGGTVRVGGRDLTTASPGAHVEAGMAFSPQEAFVFGELTVAENLELGRFAVRDDAVVARWRTVVDGLFPVLRERARVQARRLSGGQQRMLGISIALLSDPMLLLLDEPSLGLAPALVQEIFTSLRTLVDRHGISLVLVEQNVPQALAIADCVTILRGGRVILEEASETVAGRSDLWEMF